MDCTVDKLGVIKVLVYKGEVLSGMKLLLIVAIIGINCAEKKTSIASLQKKKFLLRLSTQ